MKKRAILRTKKMEPLCISLEMLLHALEQQLLNTRSPFHEARISERLTQGEYSGMTHIKNSIPYQEVNILHLIQRGRRCFPCLNHSLLKIAEIFGITVSIGNE